MQDTPGPPGTADEEPSAVADDRRPAADLVEPPSTRRRRDDEQRSAAEPATAAEPVDADEAPEARRRPAEVAARPAGKRRTAGTTRPSDLAAAEKNTDTPARPSHPLQDERPTRSRAQRQLSVSIVLVVVAVVLGGLAVFFRGQTDNLTSGDNNDALTDSAATSQVVGQLSDAIKKTFSYNYTDLESTEKAVREVLAGTALCEYDLLFAELKQYAPEQKIILATTVREIGLVRLQGDRAEALIYIDQQSTRVDVNKTVYVGGQFAVQAHRRGDRWKITKFDMFGQSLLNGKPAPTC